MNNVKTLLLQISVTISPIICFFIIKDQLPDSLPMHFNASMVADRMGDKSEFLNGLFVFLGVAILTSILMLNLSKIDPKKRIDDNSPTIKKLSWAIVLFMAFFAFAIQYIAFTYKEGQTNEANVKMIPIAVSLLFIVIGNLLNSIKANYFIGFRTPWALESEDNWRKTNALGSKTMFGAGLLMLLMVLILPAKYVSSIILPAALIAAVIPIAYSYWHFKQTSKSI
jgi:uncharacterized membrane protein